jgi:hypothetical protein
VDYVRKTVGFAMEQVRQAERERVNHPWLYNDGIWIQPASSAQRRSPRCTSGSRTSPHPRAGGARNGQVGEAKQVVSDPIKHDLDELWHKEITSKIGLNSYEDLRKELVSLAGL